MKLLISILLFSVNCFSQPIGFYNKLPTKVSAPNFDYKNPDSIGTDTYDAFGFIAQTGDDKLTYYFRSGSTHLIGGSPYFQEYTISTNTWGTRVKFDSATHDFRDVWGGRMDNDSVIVFLTTSANGIDGGNETDSMFFRKCDLDGNFKAGKTRYIGGSTGNEQLGRGSAFGGLTYLGTPGSYGIAFFQFDVTGPARYVIQFLKTTDYFNTFEVKTVYDGVIHFVEPFISFLGNGKTMCLSRSAGGGTLSMFSSLDTGNTWTYKNSTNLSWYYAEDKIGFSFVDSGYYDVIYQDRDDGNIKISKNNNIDTLLSSYGNLKFNTPELYFYNKTTSSSNPSLGYASMLRYGDGRYFVIWSRERGTYDADIWYTKDNLSIDKAIATYPDSLTVTKSASEIRIFVDGFTLQQYANVRYYEVDLSTASDFSSYVTTKINYTGNTAIECHNIHMWSTAINFLNLTTATTYYYRVRAVNSKGKSDWKTGNTTTD